jgi:hypothetical protein
MWEGKKGTRTLAGVRIIARLQWVGMQAPARQEGEGAARMAFLLIFIKSFCGRGLK